MAEGKRVAAHKFGVLSGRGRSGKTTLCRWLFERAVTAGREVVVADGDRNNAALSLFIDGVAAPDLRDDAGMLDWFAAVTDALAEKPSSVLVDLGGGDDIFEQFAAEAALADLLADAGIELVTYLLAGPDPQDLRLPGYKLGKTVVVLNEALVPAGRAAEVAFSEARENPVFTRLTSNGSGVAVTFPRLRPMGQIRTSFGAAKGLTLRSCVRQWQRQVEESFAPAAAWLP